ncbi:MAG: apolipoprotein N-acyltransferase [Hyphomicrobiaceae bacterium]
MRSRAEPSESAPLHNKIANLSGWPRALLAFSIGAASVLAVAPIFAWPVLFVTLPGLALMLGGPADMSTRQAVWRAVRTGWWFGFGYFVVGLHWIVEPFLIEADTFGWLIPFAITLLPGGLALFFALAAGIARLIWLPGWRSVFPLAAAVGFFEWLRGVVFTGFPWNPVGHGLTANDVTLQWASVFGVNGLNVLAILLFTTPGLLLIDVIRKETNFRKFAIVVICLAAAIGAGIVYGLQRNELVIADQPDIKLRLVQPAVLQTEKWKPENRSRVFEQLLDLSRQDRNGRVDDLAGVTHVIWPESAIPFLLLRTPKALEKIAALLPQRATLITGALRINAAGNSASGEREIFNSLMAFSAGAERLAQYDKIHLVPFGEYLPFQSLLESIGLEQLTRQRGGFNVGTAGRRIELPGTPAFTSLVCYEGIFSGKIIIAKERPEWLLIITNDAWFGAWAGPRQHFHQARIRAVEEGLPVVRVSNNGISAVIDPLGRLRDWRGLNVSGTVDARLPAILPPTVFSRLGHVPFWLLVLICTVTAVRGFLTRPRNFQNSQP